ncbi:MAG: hypothetical protein QHC79_22495 [Pseudosphingobacterium sp.]|nr:hypothetical protein [Pseudosphingobacterium sp.]
MNRIINASKYLKGVVRDKRVFYIGFGIKSLTEIGAGNIEIKNLLSGKSTEVLLTGKKGLLKENTVGKFVRKQPEEKITIEKHIKYYHKKWEKIIEYDREYNVWAKTLLHKYNLTLEKAKTPQGETVLHFPIMKMIDNDVLYQKACSAMNLSILLGSYFMLYDSKFEPIIPVTKYEQRKILPPGSYSLAEKLEIIKENLTSSNNVDISEGNSYRFAVLKQKGVSEVTMGLGGFNEYLMFEFEEQDLIILENLKSGNATFVFRMSKFDKKRELNKQTAYKDPAFLERIIHDNQEEWTRKLDKYFK